MRGKRRIFGFAALLSVLLAVPLVFGLGIVDFPNFSVESSSSTASVFVDPDKIIKDYLLDPSYQIGNTFTVHVNVTGATDLFTWQINMSWDPSILNVSSIIPGEVLAKSPNQTSSEALGWVVNSTDNAQGYSGFAETILGNVAGISDNGTLVSIEYLVVGYGSTDIIISVSGTLPTTLLDSEYPNPNLIPFTAVDGYFSNKLYGDVEGDGDVDWDDLVVLAGAYGSSCGEPAYDPRADFDHDCDVDWDDLVRLAGNYGTSI